tara:strand:+ start:3614 stop:4837 length:1224 start_codon:yes stop_codon:yes gene_type:complete
MKYGLFILVHHNPWLFCASLISLLLQSRQDYELHLIYIKGDGQAYENPEYQEFYDLAKSVSKENMQLTNDDPKLFKFIQNLNIKFHFHEFKNSHGLDSGAWYQLIKEKYWNKYDLSFFLMEGFLFSSKYSLDSILRVSQEKNIDFLSLGFEKRFVGYNVISKIFGQKEGKTKFEELHEKQVNKILGVFAEDKKFKDIINSWPDQIKTNEMLTTSGRTEYHVTSKKYTIFNFLKYFVKRIIRQHKIINLFKKKIFINNNGDLNLYNLEEIHPNFIKHRNFYFHEEKSPYFFGCMCQHVFSRKYLTSLNEMLEKYQIHKKIDIPFSATGLEPIWGIMPSVLKYKKWFTDAVHRPRKNYITLIREDNNERMCHYLNTYYKGTLKAFPNGDFINLEIKEKHYQFIKDKINI